MDILNPFCNILPNLNLSHDISYYSSSQLLNNTNLVDEYNNNTPSTPVMSLNLNNRIDSESIIENNNPQNSEVLNNLIIPENNESKEVLKQNIQIEDQTNKTTSVTPLNEIALPKINNIVSTASLCCIIDLNVIANQVKNIIYNPKRFSGAICSLKEPKATCLIFKNGQIVCLGARTEEDSFTTIRKLAKILKHFGYGVKLSNFKVQNIVGSFDCQFPINIREIYLKTKSNKLQYEPELFPGLIYRMNKPKITFLIFRSGKIVLTGGKKREDIFEGFQKIRVILEKYRIE